MYYSKTITSCKIIYYVYEDGRFRKRLREISFCEKEISPINCVITFKRIAAQFNENIGYEPNAPHYSNGVYLYYDKPYKGKATALDMNSAYLWALSQPLPDWETKEEVDFEDVKNEKHDFYCFENEMHRRMFFKEDYSNMLAASIWAGVKIYGFKASRHFVKTAQELYRLKCEVNKDKYKNVANIYVGCMHKRGKSNQQNTTLAAGLYALFEWNIKKIVGDFKNKGYNVIMVSTDSIKIAGEYNESDNLVEIGSGLGQFKYEYSGDADYISSGHYTEKIEKWKGMPRYLIDGNARCTFVDNIEEEKGVYETYAIT